MIRETEEDLPSVIPEPLPLDITVRQEDLDAFDVARIESVPSASVRDDDSAHERGVSRMGKDDVSKEDLKL